MSSLAPGALSGLFLLLLLLFLPARLLLSLLVFLLLLALWTWKADILAGSPPSGMVSVRGGLGGVFSRSDFSFLEKENKTPTHS